MRVKQSNMILLFIFHMLFLTNSIESALNVVINNQEWVECAICYDTKDSGTLFTFNQHPDVICSDCLNDHKKQFQDTDFVSCPWCRKDIRVEENNTITCMQNEMAKRIGQQESPLSREQLMALGISEAEINHNVRGMHFGNNNNNNDFEPNILDNRRNVRSLRDHFRAYTAQFHQKPVSAKLTDIAKGTTIAIFAIYIMSYIALKGKSYVSKLCRKIAKYYQATPQHRQLKGISYIFR